MLKLFCIVVHCTRHLHSASGRQGCNVMCNDCWNGNAGWEHRASYICYKVCFLILIIVLCPSPWWWWLSEQHQHVIWLNRENHVQVKSYLVLSWKAHTSLTLQSIYFYTFCDFKHAVYDLWNILSFLFMVTARFHKLLNSVYHVLKFFIQLRYDINCMEFFLNTFLLN